MKKRLTQHLEGLVSEQKRLIIPYIMAGDHPLGLAGLAETISFLSKAGASAIEIGIPWSDPVADGPVIEAAGQRSLAKGTSLSAILTELKRIDSPVPLVVMSYLNPIFQYGLASFVAELADTDVQGLIIPDLPYEMSDLLQQHLVRTDVALVPLVSLTTGLARQEQLLAAAEGFVYAVAVNGVTGVGATYKEELDQHLHRLKALSPIPVLTGFGVSTEADIERFNRVSDGVIVGSKIVRDLFDGNKEAVTSLIRFGSQSKSLS